MRTELPLLWLVLLALLSGCGDGADRATGPLDAEDVARNNRGVAMMGRYEYGPAFELFSEVSDRNPGEPDLAVNREIARLNRQEAGDEVIALENLESIIDRHPDHLRAMYTSGILRFYLEDPRSAKERFEAVLEVDPTDAFSHYYAGQCSAIEGDDDAALERYGRAMELDPYLRSAAYGASQVLRRRGAIDESAELLELFTRLESNPRAHLAEIKYTRMGPKAMAVVVGEPSRIPNQRPEGVVFDPPVGIPLPMKSLQEGSITGCDVDADGDVDVMLSGGRDGSVFLRNEAGKLVVEPEHPLAAVDAVLAVLWGDVDDDGRVDAFLCRDGVNQLWLQLEVGTWRLHDIQGDGEAALRTVDGAMFDADHDGDLDVFCVNSNGFNSLLNNNRDGSFRDIASETGLLGSSSASRQVLVADLDRDRDVDILVFNETAPHDVYVNDRLWAWRAGGSAFAGLVQAEVSAAVAGDIDADGMLSICTSSSDGIVWWSPDRSGRWNPERASIETKWIAPERLALTDMTGNGRLDLVASGSSGWFLAGSGVDGVVEMKADASGPMSAPLVLDPRRGPSFAVARGERLVVYPPGPGRFDFASLRFTGRTDTGASMRSNPSGIGTRVAARVGSRWTVAGTLRMDSGPGQSLQPLTIGLGGASTLDFIAVDWSDGVFQTELDLSSNRVHDIVETQRQLSSCPVIFAWDGREFRFVTDCLGVAGIGFALGRDTVSVPRPWERILLPEGVLAPRAERYELILAEPMEELCYLDAASLETWDLPPGWSMAIDDRMATGRPDPTGDAFFYREAMVPQRAVRTDVDVTADLGESDLVPADPGPLDRRFLGRLAEPMDLLLEFPRPIDSKSGRPFLLVDGWVEYPYSQTMFAAWQASASYDPPTLLAEDAHGEWIPLLPSFGYPAGMPRQMVVPMDGLPAGCRRLRLVTNLQIYWDRIQVAWSQACPSAIRSIRPFASANVWAPGYPRRSTGDLFQPGYDWSDRIPLADMRAQRGLYTAFGSAGPLVDAVDGNLAVFGTGEAIDLSWHIEPGAPRDGWTRRHVLDVRGWCKDMDLATREGDRVDPLPGVESDKTSPALQGIFNNRYRSGF